MLSVLKLQLIYQVSVCAFVLQSLQSTFKGKWLGIICIFIEFQIVHLSLFCKQYYASVIFALSIQTKSTFFNILSTPSIFSGTILTSNSPTISATLWCRNTGGKGASLQFLPTLCGLGPCVLQRKRGRHIEARVHTAEQHSRKASYQPSVEGKTAGYQPEQF